MKKVSAIYVLCAVASLAGVRTWADAPNAVPTARQGAGVAALPTGAPQNPAPVRAEPRSDLAFDSDVWDFGTIKEEDGPVSHEFVFTNVGDKPVVIERVSVSCGCTTPTYSRRPVMPGASSTVGITFDPEHRPGRFNKTVNILSGGGRNRNVLKVTGTVEPRPRSVEEDYPFELAGGVRADMLHRGFGYVSHGETKSMVINLVNTSASAVRLDTAGTFGGGLLRIDFPESLGAGGKAALTLTYDLRGNCGYGMLSEGTYLTVNGIKPALPMNATAIAVDDFSGTDYGKAPQAEVSPMFHNFGEGVKGKTLRKRFTLTNTGGGVLHLRAVILEDNTAADLRPGIEVAPGGKVEFEMVFRPRGIPDTPVFGGVTIITDDPRRPMRDIKVGGVI